MRKRKGNYSKKLLPALTNNFVGLNIQKHRRNQNIKQETLAKAIGVSRISLSNYENNIWPVPLDILLLAANVLHIGADLLLEDVPPPPKSL